MFTRISLLHPRAASSNVKDILTYNQTRLILSMTRIVKKFVVHQQQEEENELFSNSPLNPINRITATKDAKEISLRCNDNFPSLQNLRTSFVRLNPF